MLKQTSACSTACVELENWSMPELGINCPARSLGSTPVPYRMPPRLILKAKAD
jgi:hypothetical protein